VALGQLTVTIDGAALGPHITGTQLHILELVAALVRSGKARVRVRVPRTIGAAATAALDAHDVPRFFADETDDLEPTDVAHRPFQVVTPLDLTLLRRMGKRIVLTQQDLIAYRNPTYFADYAAWAGYRELTRAALASADRVAFFSEDAAHDARQEGLVEDERSAVVHIGVDHSAVPVAVEPRAPAAAPALGDRPFLLALGTDFAHKNRPFAMEVFSRLRREHGYGGRLVLAGPPASTGTSREAEMRWRAAQPAEADDVVDLGPVGEPEKAWLYAHADLVLYPTVHEGFGLVPFEAAAAGAPCAWAAQTSLAEVLPPGAALLEPWNAEESARAVAAVLADPGARERQVAAVREAGTRWTWDRTAAGMLAVYRAAVTAPPRALAEPEDALPDTALALVGPSGYVPPDVQQALLAISTRETVRRPVFGALRVGYRAFYRARRAGSGRSA
jgi:Glycosyl transferases group 1